MSLSYWSWLVDSNRHNSTSFFFPPQISPFLVAPQNLHMLAQATRRSWACKYFIFFISVSLVCLSVQSGPFYVVAPQPPHPTHTQLHQNTVILLPLQLRGGSRVELGLYSQSSEFSYSGLGQDGLGLGFLSRHNRTLLTITTETELDNTNKSSYSMWIKGIRQSNNIANITVFIGHNEVYF